MRKLSQRTLTTAAVAVLALVLSVPALADPGADVQRFEENFSSFVPCLGERVSGVVEHMYVGNSFTNPAGIYQSHWQFTLRGTLTGESTGNVYRFFSSQHENYVNNRPPNGANFSVIPMNDHYVAVGPGGQHLLVNYHWRGLYADGQWQWQVSETNARCIEG